jgi:hypothetical protein
MTPITGRRPLAIAVVANDTFQVVVFDAADLAAESSFWAGVFGGTVDAEDDWHMVEVDGQFGRVVLSGDADAEERFVRRGA